MTTTDDGMSWEEKRRIRIPGAVDGAIRCQTCRYVAVRVGPWWICRNLACDRLVVR